MLTEVKRVVGAPANLAEGIRPGSAPTLSPKVSIKALVLMPEWRGVYTESAIRGLIDKARTRRSSRGPVPGNGLIAAGALIKVGRRILIDTDKFRAWVESHRISQETE